MIVELQRSKDPPPGFAALLLAKEAKTQAVTRGGVIYSKLADYFLSLQGTINDPRTNE